MKIDRVMAISIIFKKKLSVSHLITHLLTYLQEDLYYPLVADKKVSCQCNIPFPSIFAWLEMEISMPEGGRECYS